MGILKCCKNCSLEHLPYDDNCMGCKFWYEDNKKVKDLFIPKEELVRADEKHKFITLLKSDLENYEGLAREARKNYNMWGLIENNAVRRYIEETIEVIKEE